ncbi:MAG: rhodanese-like domain-containing protein [Alphaproteobacteria bacterium]
MSTELENWSAERVYEALSNNKIVLIDVRTPQEYMFEHVEGALLAPMAFFKAASLPAQDKKRIVLHCGSGARSEKVGKQCLAQGLVQMAHLEGGFAAWKQAGLPYIGTDMMTGAPKPMNQQSS